ncbi:MAG: hypothetical protein U1C18_00910, partial [Patescibacteria group bacterium]|nr:hypothetical protein [Patescibacteria group bacterium]
MDVAVLGGSTEFESLKTGQELGRLLRQSGHAIHTFGFGHGAIAVSRGVSVAEPDVPASDRMAPCDLTYIVWEGVSYIDRLDRLIKEPDAYV